MKLTKRKGFNFFRSYYDVYNELTTDKEKVDFLDALLDRQFLGTKPTELTGMANFAYISQTNSIDSQVKGYEDKIKVRLDGRPYYKDDVTPTDGVQTTPTDGVNETNLTPTLQEEEKGEVQEKVKGNSIDFDKVLDIFNSTVGRKCRVIPSKAKAALKQRLKDGYTKQDFVKAITNASKDQHHIDTNYKYLTIEFITRADKFERFVNMSDFKIAQKIL